MYVTELLSQEADSHWPPRRHLAVTGVTPPSGAQLRRWCQSALNLCLIIVSGPFGPLSCFITVVVILSSFSPLPDIIFPFLSGKPPQGCGMPRNAGATPGARVRGSNLWTEGRRGLANGNQGAVLPAVGTAAGRGKRGALDLSSRLTSAPLSWHLLLEPWTLCFRLPTSLPGEPFSASWQATPRFRPAQALGDLVPADCSLSRPPRTNTFPVCCLSRKPSLPPFIPQARKPRLCGLSGTGS